MFVKVFELIYNAAHRNTQSVTEYIIRFLKIRFCCLFSTTLLEPRQVCHVLISMAMLGKLTFQYNVSFDEHLDLPGEGDEVEPPRLFNLRECTPNFLGQCTSTMSPK